MAKAETWTWREHLQHRTHLSSTGMRLHDMLLE